MQDRKLVLQRPLVSFDLETTGLDVTCDRIVEISCVKLSPDGTREIRTRRVDPGIPISASATSVHGICDSDVVGEPTFAQLAQTLADFLFQCDLTGFNIEAFDLPILKKEFERVNMTFPEVGVQILDSFRIFQSRESRDLSAAYRFYCGKKLEKAHSAEADAEAAAEILLAQVVRYEDMPCNVVELQQHCKKAEPHWVDPEGKIVWVGDEAALGFGKHRHRTLREMALRDADYLKWILKSEFSEAVKQLIALALSGNFPKRQQVAS
jgi:DNA polymerase III subunit epsilon